MAHRFTTTRRVEFADTDLAGIMHFSNFFRFMEVTEHEFYRTLGFSAHPAGGGSDGGPHIGWPRVSASCEFHVPLGFEDEVEIELLVEEVRGKSVRYLFRFWKTGNGTAGERRLAATGRMTAVCVQLKSEGGGMKAVTIPDHVRAKIEQAPRELIEIK